MTGHAGFEKSQDCVIRVTLRESGGQEILLHSKQAQIFGTAIRRCVTTRLQELGVEQATVEVFDFGCLDFVIRARLKTAVDRARRVGHE